MEKYLIFLFLIGLILLGGCTAGEKAEDQKPGIVDEQPDIADEEPILKVSLSTQKDTYELEEPFELTLNIDYAEEPFNALIIYDSYREGFSKHYYNGYLEKITREDINRSRFHAGYPGKKAFKISDGIKSAFDDYFSDEGTYYISVYIFDCDIISNEGYDCTPSNVHPSNFALFDDTPENLIKNNVEAMASDEIQITAVRGELECKSDYVCELFEKCVNNECVLKTCDELGGNVCSNASECIAVMWDASDTDYCCPLQCN